MTPEWMIAIDRVQALRHRKDQMALFDPLEREEWRGLEWVSELMGRLFNQSHVRLEAPSRKTVTGWRLPQETASRHI